MLLNSADDLAASTRFLDLPGVVYRDDPFYCATPPDAVLVSLGREPFQGRQAVLVQIDGVRSVARVVARLSPTLTDRDGRPLGMLGFFEALDEPEHVAALFRGAIRWLHERGASEIVGPMDGDTWHRYRLNVGPFQQPPFLMEPYNRPYYQRLWESAGFRLFASYYSKRVDKVELAARELRPILDRQLRHGYRLRTIDLGRFEDELAILHRLSTAIFAENFLYEQISLADFLEMYRPLRSFIDSDLVRIAISPQGEPVGFMFSLVDYQAAVAAMRGKRNLLARLRFFLRRSLAAAVNLKSLGVLPGHRKSGLGAALTCQAYRDVIAKGYRQANLCLIRQDNPSGRLDAGQGDIFRRYILYRYTPGSQHD